MVLQVRTQSKVELEAIDILDKAMERREQMKSDWSAWDTAEALIYLTLDVSNKYTKTTQEERKHDILNALTLTFSLNEMDSNCTWEILVQLKACDSVRDSKPNLRLDWTEGLEQWKSGFKRVFNSNAVMMANFHGLVAGFCHAGISTEYDLFDEAMRDLPKDFYSHYDRLVQAAALWVLANPKELEDTYCRESISRAVRKEDMVKCWNTRKKVFDVLTLGRIGKEAWRFAQRAGKEMNEMRFDEDGCFWFGTRKV